jgi:hypothetical protein
MGEGQIFPKNLQASLFNDDLSIEPNFDRIQGNTVFKDKDCSSRWAFFLVLLLRSSRLSLHGNQFRLSEMICKFVNNESINQ